MTRELRASGRSRRRGRSPGAEKIAPACRERSDENRQRQIILRARHCHRSPCSAVVVHCRRPDQCPQLVARARMITRQPSSDGEDPLSELKQSFGGDVRPEDASLSVGDEQGVRRALEHGRYIGGHPPVRRELRAQIQRAPEMCVISRGQFPVRGAKRALAPGTVDVEHSRRSPIAPKPEHHRRMALAGKHKVVVVFGSDKDFFRDDLVVGQDRHPPI